MRTVEIESADTLLDIGVSIPLLSVRFPFTKKRFTVRVTMRRPTMGSLIRILRIYLQMGIRIDEIPNLSKEQEFELIINHGKKVAEIVMLAILRDGIRVWLFGRLLKWILLWFVSDDHLTAINATFAPLYATRSFGNIIRSVEGANPLTPRVSQEKKGS